MTSIHFFPARTLCRTSQQSRFDLNFGGKRAMHRAFVGDFQKPGALFVAERSAQLNAALDPGEEALFGLAFGAIDGVNLRVAQVDRDLLEWPALAACVHSPRPCTTRPPGGKHTIVRGRARA